EHIMKTPFSISGAAALGAAALGAGGGSLSATGTSSSSGSSGAGGGGGGSGGAQPERSLERRGPASAGQKARTSSSRPHQDPTILVDSDPDSGRAPRKAERRRVSRTSRWPPQARDVQRGEEARSRSRSVSLGGASDDSE
ncbi:unnamed protein product, partial [Polarella glacialis]